MESYTIKKKLNEYKKVFFISCLYMVIILILIRIDGYSLKHIWKEHRLLASGGLVFISIGSYLACRRMDVDRKTIIDNLNELKEKEKAIREAYMGVEAQRRLTYNVLESTLSFVLGLDKDFNIIKSTENLKDMTEFEEEDLKDKKLSSFINCEYVERIKKALENKDSYGLEMEIESKYGKKIYTHGTIMRESQGYPNKRYNFILYDISKNKGLQDEVRYLDSYDPITDLPNRTLMERVFTSKIPEISRNNNPAALLYIDIDHFTLINETKGHHAGDQLLMDIAERLKGVKKERDILARITQDKFTIIFTHEKSLAAIEKRIKEVVNATNIEWEFEGKRYVISTTIGVSLYPKDGLDFIKLLKSANLALEYAKENSRMGYEYYNENNRCLVVDDLTMVSDIRIALKNQEFKMDYQPIYNMKTGKIENVESLIRWYHPDKGYISPDEFIPAAERYRVICGIGEYTLEEVFRQKVEWNSLGYKLPMISVNISAISFGRVGFTEYIGEKLESYGLKGNEIVLELTESGFSSHSEYIEENAKSLRKLGVKISMDDFGTGYSSLARLKNLPIDDIKLDRAFIVSLLEDNGQEIIQTLISLARALGKDVVSEGIETKEQYDILKKLGSKYGQGYYLSRPMSPEDLGKILKKQ